MTEANYTGYPSVDKPWLKYYSEEAINAELPECTIYEYLLENNKDNLDDVALTFFGKAITYRQLFWNIDRTAIAFSAIGVKENDVVTLQMLNQPEMVYAFYALSKIGAVTCVVNVLSSPKELVHYLQETNSRYLISLDIEKHKSVSKCCTVCVQLQPDIYAPVCYIVPKGKDITQDIMELNLRTLCEIELPEYARPVKYVIIDSLPCTSVGKIDYRELEKEAMIYIEEETKWMEN